jgi:hypothetical protein
MGLMSELRRLSVLQQTAADLEKMAEFGARWNGRG